jgi:BirA family biotin operon repressor/biotin-[acetyl-CoA-carboxylase] ligase
LVFPSPEWTPSPLASAVGCGWLTALAAVATAELVSDLTGADARIKWPNDVRVDGRKIAGILVERALPAPATALRGGDGRPNPRGAVIGIGLNVNLDPDDFAPDLRDRITSLVKLSREREMDRSDLARRLIILLDLIYDNVKTSGMAALSRLWRARSEHLEQMVHVTTREGRLEGRVVDLDLERGLTLDLDVAGSDAIRTMQLPLESILTLEE